jgi:RNA-binding protein
MELNGKQRRALRALGHHLDPVVMVGRDGVGPTLVAATAQALLDHELIKVKVGEASPVDRHEAADSLAQATGAAVAQVLGRTVLLFLRRAEDPEIALPGLPLPPKPDKPVVLPPRRRRPRPHGPGSRQRR